MRRHEIFQYVQSLSEIRFNRQFNRTSGCISHQATHTRQLFNLFIGTTRSGICHHIDVIILIQAVQKFLRQNVVRLFPGLNDFLISLFLRNQATLIVLGNLIHRILRVLNQLRLFRRHRHVRNRYRHRSPGGILVTHSLYVIQHLCRLRRGY